MPDKNPVEYRLPIAPMKILALSSCLDFARKVDAELVDIRRSDSAEELAASGSLHYKGYDADSYLLKNSCPRFGSGEGKGVVEEFVRGYDVYIMVDVTNDSLTYNVNGAVNRMSPDDNFQDLKRIVSACVAVAHRVNVIMPFLYESRQHRRTGRESLDCANALVELEQLGVKNIITFDAHDPRVSNAIPLTSFDTYSCSYRFIKTLFNHVSDFEISKEKLMIISPDEGGMDRAIYMANHLGVDLGMFYKRRNYSVVVDGRNPIVAHEFLGSSVEGKTVLVIDDMISSGESLLDTAKELKERGAARVIACATFGLFTSGVNKFNDYYNNGIIDYVCTTNLNHRPAEVLDQPWYLEADMSRYLAVIINAMNHDCSLKESLSTFSKIQSFLQSLNSDGYEYFSIIE